MDNKTEQTEYKKGMNEMKSIKKWCKYNKLHAIGMIEIIEIIIKRVTLHLNYVHLCPLEHGFNEFTVETD